MSGTTAGMSGTWTRLALAVVAGGTTVFLGAAILAYNPSKGLIGMRGGPGG